MSDFSLSHISESDDHTTPSDFLQMLDAEFHFDDDPCPLHGIALQDGLSRAWGKRVFMNPPYSKPTPWVKKAFEEAQSGSLVVGLLRGDTSAAWFHDWVLGKAEIRFIRGRLKFNGKPAPFASILAVWRPKETIKGCSGWVSPTKVERPRAQTPRNGGAESQHWATGDKGAPAQGE